MEREGHCIKRGSAESEGRGAGAPGAAEGGTRPSGPRRIPRPRCGEQAVCYLSAAADDGSGSLSRWDAYSLGRKQIKQTRTESANDSRLWNKQPQEGSEQTR